MRFNQNQSYRWVSQPRKFAGQTLEWSNDKQNTDGYALRSEMESSKPKSGFFRELQTSLQTAIQQFRQQPQN